MLSLNVTAPTAVYTLSLHDALPISAAPVETKRTDLGFIFGEIPLQPRRQRQLLRRAPLHLGHRGRMTGPFWRTVFKLHLPVAEINDLSHAGGQPVEAVASVKKT